MFSLKTSSLRSATVFQQLTAIKIDTDSSLTDQIVKKGVSVRRLCVDNFLLPLTARLRGWGLLLPASMDICMLYISVHWHHGSSSVLVFNTRKTLFVMFPTPPWMLQWSLVTHSLINNIRTTYNNTRHINSKYYQKQKPLINLFTHYEIQFIQYIMKEHNILPSTLDFLVILLINTSVSVQVFVQLCTYQLYYTVL